MVNSKHAFWQAFLVTLFVFIAGLVLGFYIEVSNVSNSDLLIRESEVELLDQQIKISSLTSGINQNCESAKQNLFDYADQIYFDAINFEEDGSRSKLTVEQMKVLHKRYDLLRINLWLESLELEKKCGSNFHTIVYFFDYDTKDVDVKSEQRIFSLVLMDLKYKYPDEVLLLPIASNLELGSVDVFRENYNVTKIPSILVDESLVLDSLLTMEELENKIFEKSNNTSIILLNK